MKTSDEINKLVTYDYDKQRWVTGAEALTCLIAQQKRQIKLMQSDKAEGYIKASGRRETAKELCEAAEKELKRLQQLQATITSDN